MYADNGLDYDDEMKASLGAAGVMPLIVSEAEIAPLTVRVDLESFGPTTRQEHVGFEVPEALSSGEPGRTVGSVVGDVSGVLNPFISAAHSSTWPAADAPAQDESTPWFSHYLVVVDQDSPTGYSPSAGGVRLDSSGFVDPVRQPNSTGGAPTRPL